MLDPSDRNSPGQPRAARQSGTRRRTMHESRLIAEIIIIVWEMRRKEGRKEEAPNDNPQEKRKKNLFDLRFLLPFELLSAVTMKTPFDFFPPFFALEVVKGGLRFLRKMR